MAHQFYNPNPYNKSVGDCVIRALCKAFDKEWHSAYADVVTCGYYMCDMPSSNAVWSQYLKEQGYERFVVPNTCPDCYTIEDFCVDHPQGTHIVCTGSHVVCVIDGTAYDSWNSLSENPLFYFSKGE